jgi:hypothetical protein
VGVAVGLAVGVTVGPAVDPAVGPAVAAATGLTVDDGLWLPPLHACRLNSNSSAVALINLRI